MFQKTLRSLGLAGVVVGVGLLLAPEPAYAQRSGGGQRSGGRFGLTWVSGPVNRVVPTISGAVSVSTYITTLSVDVRVDRVNLPNNTRLTVTVYAVDYFTGKPWPPRQAGIITLAGGRGVLVSNALWTTAPRGIPVVTSVVITAPNGVDIAIGTP